MRRTDLEVRRAQTLAERRRNAPKYYPPGVDLPPGICPGCRSARPVGRPICQACAVSAAEEWRHTGGWLPTLPGTEFEYRGGPYGQVDNRPQRGRQEV